MKENKKNGKEVRARVLNKEMKYKLVHDHLDPVVH